MFIHWIFCRFSFFCQFFFLFFRNIALLELVDG